jgi:hypothetical protein
MPSNPWTASRKKRAQNARHRRLAIILASRERVKAEPANTVVCHFREAKITLSGAAAVGFSIGAPPAWVAAADQIWLSASRRHRGSDHGIPKPKRAAN